MMSLNLNRIKFHPDGESNGNIANLSYQMNYKKNPHIEKTSPIMYSTFGNRRASA